MAGRKRLLDVPLLISLVFAFTAALAAGRTDAQDVTFRQYQLELQPDDSRYDLVVKRVSMPSPGQHQVLVRVRAAALNGGLDVEMLGATGPGAPNLTGRVPLSDAAGEVIAVGTDVTRFSAGDRVATTFVQGWVDGDLAEEYLDSIRGLRVDGVLSEFIISDESALVLAPPNLSYEEAATLPVAGLVAWAGLFKYGNLQPGQYVLLEGTGGVSSFGLVFSVAARARPIITSSSDTKLARAVALGAIGAVNYRTNPEWQNEVRSLTGGAGVKQVLEVGGRETLSKALQTLAYGGHVALIGELSGVAQEIPALPLLRANGRLSAIYVGSRTDFEAMNEFIAEHDVKPVIDRVFEFDDAPAAFEYMARGDYMGKIVIRL